MVIIEKFVSNVAWHVSNINSIFDARVADLRETHSYVETKNATKAGTINRINVHIGPPSVATIAIRAVQIISLI